MVSRLCALWGAQLTEKEASGKRCQRADRILIKELTAVCMEKAKEHFRTKASQSQPPASVSGADACCGEHRLLRDAETAGGSSPAPGAAGGGASGDPALGPPPPSGESVHEDAEREDPEPQIV